MLAVATNECLLSSALFQGGGRGVRGLIGPTQGRASASCPRYTHVKVNAVAALLAEYRTGELMAASVTSSCGLRCLPHNIALAQNQMFLI